MVEGVGTDIIEIERIREVLRSRAGFAQRVFTEAERRYCMEAADPAERFAGRFAAKEAVAKALGVSLPWRDVEILPDGLGRPSVTLRNGAAERGNGRRVLVSISHCRAYAVAYATVVAADSHQG